MRVPRLSDERAEAYPGSRQLINSHLC
jgi:hypothetical protein